MSVRTILRAAVSALALCAHAFFASGALAQSAPPLTPLEQQARDGAVTVQRLAVVFGLGSYQSTPPLSNTINDARAIAAMLRSHGFQVIEGYDLDKQQFETMLRDAVMAGGGRSEVLFFYAGHGIQIGSHNYLLPIDARLNDKYDVPFHTVSLDSILDTLSARSQTQLAFLDSCRNNPFEGKNVLANVRGIGAPILRGFAQPQPPANTLLAFSTAPGALALDGQGPNSPYTSALLSAAQISPDSSIETLLSAVSQLVEETTAGQQRPTHASALSLPFTLRKPAVSLAMSTVPLAPQAAPLAQSSPSVGVSAPTASVIAVPTASVGVSTPSAFAPTTQGQPPSLTAPRERVIGIGERLLQQIPFQPGARIRVLTAPVGMAFGLLTRSGTIATAPADISASELSALVLRPTGVEARNISSSTGIASDTMQLETLDATGSAQLSVPVTLVPNACDVEAGDWFDPQGVGLYRFDTALRPAEALSACDAALRQDPSNARFRHQLARGLQAAGRAGEAESLYRQAAEAGHTRAWLGYGKLLAARGDVTGADAAFNRGRAGGDPRATAALGDLRLRNARGEADRQAAYELLIEGVDLGLWESMDSLAQYYANPASPDADPLRAQRFASEAAQRRSIVPIANVTPRSNMIPEDNFREGRGAESGRKQ